MMCMLRSIAADVLQDDLAVSVAHVTATANKRARELGVDVLQSLITVSQQALAGGLVWRVNYGPKEYVGRRGGDLIVEVDPTGKTVMRTQWGQ